MAGLPAVTSTVGLFSGHRDSWFLDLFYISTKHLPPLQSLHLSIIYGRSLPMPNSVLQTLRNCIILVLKELSVYKREGRVFILAIEGTSGIKSQRKAQKRSWSIFLAIFVG